MNGTSSARSARTFSFNSLMRPILIGAAVGAVVSFAFLILSALILSFGILPISAASVIASLSVAIGSFFAGKTAARKVQKNGLFIGLICGAVMFLIFTAISLMAFKSTPTVSTLTRLIIFLTASGIGGIFGVSSKNSRKIV